MKNFLSLIVLVTLTLLIFSCKPCNESSAPKVKVKDGIFIHVSHGVKDPHRVLMALSLADKMAEDKDVILYFDIEGIEVVLKDASDLTFSHFASSQAQLQKLLDKGITIMACPGCLKAAGKTPDDLRKGITVADKEKFFNFTSGRIVSIDY
jgi:predicted peroxiredoxin